VALHKEAWFCNCIFASDNGISAGFLKSYQ
jgi:hypothetical protein